MQLSMPKSSLLTKSWQYGHVYKHGQRLRGYGFTLIFHDNGKNYNRLGISVSGVKLAVKRNRIKRLLKEFYRQDRSFPSKMPHRPAIGQGLDLVIATNKKFAPAGLADVTAAFKPFLNR